MPGTAHRRRHSSHARDLKSTILTTPLLPLILVFLFCVLVGREKKRARELLVLKGKENETTSKLQTVIFSYNLYKTNLHVFVH